MSLVATHCLPQMQALLRVFVFLVGTLSVLKALHFHLVSLELIRAAYQLIFAVIEFDGGIKDNAPCNNNAHNHKTFATQDVPPRLNCVHRMCDFRLRTTSCANFLRFGEECSTVTRLSIITLHATQHTFGAYWWRFIRKFLRWISIELWQFSVPIWFGLSVRLSES